MTVEQGQNPQAQNPPGETDAEGSLDAAALAFGKRDEPVEAEKQVQAEETEAEPDHEAEAESDEEAEQADPAEDEAKDNLVEVEIDGKTYRVPEELQKGQLRQAEFSRKMNEVSAKEKVFTQRLEIVEGLEKSADKRAEALAEVRAIDARIKSYDGVDWAKARAENPAEAAMAAIELLSLKDQRKDAVQAAASIAREMTEGKNKLLGEARADMEKTLQKELKGWGDELGTKITKFALEKGYSVEDIQKVTDPKWVIAMDNWRKYDALQKGKSELKAKVKDVPPVLKPGSPRQPNKADDAMARLRKSNSLDDAAAAFGAMRTR